MLDVIVGLVLVLFVVGVIALRDRLPDDDSFKYWVDEIPHRAKDASPAAHTTKEVAA